MIVSLELMEESIIKGGKIMFIGALARNDYSSVVPDFFIAFFLIIFGLALLIFIAVMVLTIIINWKALKKMGNDGWKALIPVYNTWSMCEGIGINPHWSWIVVILYLISSVLPLFGEFFDNSIIIYIPNYFVTPFVVYFSVIYCIAFARSFGKEDVYAILLFFFFPIVGLFLVKNEYVGAKGCHDFLFDDIIKLNKKEPVEAIVVSTENKEDNNSSKLKYCSNCGKKITAKSKFCSNCGKEFK